MSGTPFVGVRPPGWLRDDGTDGPSPADWAALAEALNFDVLFVGDRLLATARGEDSLSVYQAAMLDPFVTLANMAAVTERIRLAPLVAVVPFRHPVYMAKMTASLDVVSNGRFIFGAGAGWSDPELRLFGVPRTGRGAILEEGIDLVRRLWRGEPVSHDGHWTFSDATVLPKPIQEGGPPVWLGSFAPDDRALWSGTIRRSQADALRRIGRIGDGWVPLTYSAGYGRMISPELLEEARTVIDHEAETIGRNKADIDTIYPHWIAVVRNESERRACERALSRFFPGNLEEARETYLIGTPAEIIDTVKWQVSRLDAVAGYLLTPIVPSEGQWSAIAEEVAPALREIRGQAVGSTFT